MTKSFCAGCKHWQLYDDHIGTRFYGCYKFLCWENDLRKKFCGGKYYTKESG